MYKIQKSLNRLRNGQATFFLDPIEQQQLAAKLTKEERKIYYPYKDSEKNIFYSKKKPDVVLFEIISKVSLKHQEIMGSIFSLNISNEMFGDILIIDEHYYVYVLGEIRNYFEANFLMVKNSYIELRECDLDLLANYEREYEKLEIIVSSERIDTIISTIIHVGRNSIKDKQKNKEIMLNYDFLKDVSYKLKVGDIFSIKKFGKYKYEGIIKTTKSNNLIVSIYKYL